MRTKLTTMKVVFEQDNAWNMYIILFSMDSLYYRHSIVNETFNIHTV